MTDAAVRVPAGPGAPGEGGSVRFRIALDGVERLAFVVRWHGTLHAFVNTCRHQSLALDLGDGRFLDGDDIVCAQHGARYRPDTVECTDGPCRGAFLTRLALEERGGELWCTGRAPRG